MTLHPLLIASGSLLCAIGLTSALAAEPVLLTGPKGVSVNADDVRADAQRIPAELRAQTLRRPEDVAQMAQNLYVRRVLAAEAEQAQLDKDPRVAALLRLARDRVLSEARMAQIEGSAPEPAVLERLAQTEYRAKPEAFNTPEQVRARHILIDAKSCDAEKRIAGLLEQARAPGADFAALAREHSQDPGSAPRGGDLGFFGRGRMAKAFEAAAFAMKEPGELTGVVKTEFGYHIIRLEERKPAGRQTFEQVREDLMRDIAARELRARRTAVVEAIVGQMKIDVAAIEAFAQQSR
jgi:peptidyl-prolyl cis-trans isomerase C